MRGVDRIFILAIAFLLVFSSMIFAVSPSGVSTIDPVNSTTALPDDPQSVQAQAGNVTELNVFGYTSTQTWQGYFGNVSGTIQLADSGDNVLYNWSLAEPEGEIYASTANSIDWSSIACFDFATDGAALESSYNIASDDVDGVNETFAVKNHDAFYTNNILIGENTCDSVQLFDSTGSSVDGFFEEVLLSDGANTIFASILEEAGVNGFDNRDHDFEMLVLEDGHGTDTSTTPYYFYVELQ